MGHYHYGAGLASWLAVIQLTFVANILKNSPVKRINENSKQLLPKAPSPINGGLEIAHLNIGSLKSRPHLLDRASTTGIRKEKRYHYNFGNLA